MQKRERKEEKEKKKEMRKRKRKRMKEENRKKCDNKFDPPIIFFAMPSRTKEATVMSDWKDI